MNDSVKAANLGRWLPPWTVTRVAWHKPPRPHVSGVSTDAVLFSENGSQFVFGSLPSGPVPMPGGRPSVTRSGRPSLRRHRVHRLRYLAVFNPGDWMTSLQLVKLLWRCPRSYQKCRQGPRHQRSSRQPRPMTGQLRPMPLLCRSRGWYFMVNARQYCRYQYRFHDLPTRISPVATQQYPSSPESRASTVCIDLDAFGSEYSRSGDCNTLVSPGAVDREGVSLVEPLDMSTVVERVAQLFQESGFSSIQLLPNRVCEHYTYNTLDVFPVFQVSPDVEGYYPDTSPLCHRISKTY